MPSTRNFLRQQPGLQLAFLPEVDAGRIAETIAAFANTEGGTLVLGIDAEGTVGSRLVDEDVDGALQTASRMCKPPVPTKWDPDQISGVDIIQLHVPKSSEAHLLLDGRMLVRRGSENVEIESPGVVRMTAHVSTADFELDAVAGASRSDFDEDVIDEYMERRQKRTPRSQVLPKDKLLHQIGAITDDGTPTVSGLLLFGKEPQLFLPQSKATFVKFGDTQPRQPGGGIGYGRREELVGPLPVIVERAWRVTWEEMNKRAVVKGLQREEETEYPEVAVRESLVNAVAHRDYRMTGRGIEIRMYTDRVEVTSPGGLPAHITLDNIIDEHYSRNPRIVNGLYQWGYIEELGLGVDSMIDAMVNAGHMPPEFDATDSRFTVRLFNRKDPARVVQQWEHTMNERQMKVLEYLQRNQAITNREYRELCPHVGAETLRLDLADLVTKGILLKIGEKRGTRYILKHQ
jgi:ATP-dependent DNA helicase RecG